MASEELIQSFNNVRDYIRSFFIYGYKSRLDFAKYVKDRTYGAYLHKIDNWLSTFSVEAKNSNKESIHYIQVDSHEIDSNPFYETLKTRIFKDIQITAHFYIIDALKKNPHGLSLDELHAKFEAEYVYDDNDFMPNINDDQFRYLLNDYEKLGIIKSSNGKPKIYMLNDDIEITPSMLTAIQFFSETDDRNALQRALLAFSDYKKSVIYVKQQNKLDIYQMTLEYFPFDETELLIRILSMGHLVKVIVSEELVQKVKERIQKQANLFRKNLQQ